MFCVSPPLYFSRLPSLVVVFSQLEFPFLFFIPDVVVHTVVGCPAQAAGLTVGSTHHQHSHTRTQLPRRNIDPTTTTF